MGIALGIATPAKHVHPVHLNTRRKQPEPISWVGAKQINQKTDKCWCKQAGVTEHQFKLINTVTSTFTPGCVTNQHKNNTPLLDSGASLT